MSEVRRWVLTEGTYGRPAPEYILIRAARYLGVAPWELARQDARWTAWALFVEGLEAEQLERAQKKARRR